MKKIVKKKTSQSRYHTVLSFCVQRQQRRLRQEQLTRRPLRYTLEIIPGVVYSDFQPCSLTLTILTLHMHLAP
jgi:hypothetical protein